MKNKGDKKNKFIIESTSTFRRTEKNLLNTEVDGEVVLMNTESGEYWGLNETSTSIWALIEVPLTFGEITKTLLTEYNVEEELCKKETMSVLLGLHNIGLLDIQT